MSKSGKKPRIHVEEVKVSHTTHWDLDYLPECELEALYAKAVPADEDPPRDPERRSGGTRVLWIVLGAVALLLLLAMGTLYFF
jgi:hypothetical protein